MSEKSKAQFVREELLRRHGWGSRQVSVRSDRLSIRCEIKVPGITRAAVEEVAKKHEHISYCEASGEVLLGGNTYVTVGFADELTAELDRAIRAWAEALPEDGLTLAPCAAVPELLVWRTGPHDFWVEDSADPDSLPDPCMGSSTVGTHVARLLVERGVTELGTPAEIRTAQEELRAALAPIAPTTPAAPYTSAAEQVPADEEPSIHEPRDESCRLDAAGDCRLCGLHHGAPCACCGGRAYHRQGCVLSDSGTAGLIGVEVIRRGADGRTRHCKIRRVELGGVLLEPLLGVEGSQPLWSSLADVEPAFPDDFAAGVPVVFTPWACEGPNEPTAGYVVGSQGFLLDIQSLGDQPIRVQRLPASVTAVDQGEPCPECTGWGWVVYPLPLQVGACDRCGRYDDATAVAAATAFAASRGVSPAALAGFVRSRP